MKKTNKYDLKGKRFTKKKLKSSISKRVSKLDNEKFKILSKNKFSELMGKASLPEYNAINDEPHEICDLSWDHGDPRFVENRPTLNLIDNKVINGGLSGFVLNNQSTSKSEEVLKDESWIMTDNELKNFVKDYIAKLKNYKSLEYTRYTEMIRNRKLKPFEKLSVLAHLHNPSMYKKPMCLIPRNIKKTEVRKIVKKGQRQSSLRLVGGLMKIMPDDKFLHRFNKGLAKDAFNKLSVDDRIKWARNVVSVTGLDIIENNYIRNEHTNNLLNMGMRYACILSGIPYSVGNFATAFVIRSRVYSYYKSRTNEENVALTKILSESEQRCKILSYSQTEILLNSIIKQHNIREEFDNVMKKLPIGTSKLSIVNNLINKKKK